MTKKSNKSNNKIQLDLEVLRHVHEISIPELERLDIYGGYCSLWYRDAKAWLAEN